jgi:peptide/nickel transport system substrate-binding protein
MGRHTLSSKATYDKIIFPPEGVVSVRKGSYLMVKSIKAPDARTVVFRLKWAAPSLLANLASPWNFIYKADILAKDPHDGYRAIFIKSSSARVAAVRGGRALIEFRGFPPSSRDDLVNSLQDKIRVQSGPWLCYLSVARAPGSATSRWPLTTK